jgi:pimeloyl-ACP methyl ester carboxylesterase
MGSEGEVEAFLRDAQVRPGVTPARDSTIRLPDGRVLAFAEWGDLDGRPVFLFHGMPGSRLLMPDPDAAVDEHVRVITADRPGMGKSEPQPGHRMGDWPADVVALADALDLGRFGVVGWSAGTPYVFACAALIPERLTGAAATTSAASLRYLFDQDAELREALIDDDERAILEMLPQGRDATERRVAADAADWVRGIAERPEQLAEGSDPGDEWYLEDPDRRSNFVESFREAVRQGAEAMAPQFVAQIAPWGFRLEDIAMPVHVWAGANDRITPPDLMRRVADRIPDHTFTVWEDVGHAGIAKYLRDVLREL